MFKVKFFFKEHKTQDPKLRGLELNEVKTQRLNF